MKQLTVVIPAYNAEKFLEQCLDSLLQTMEREGTELIVVNDGSTDKTGTLADGYAQKHPEIVSVIHKENGGHGSAINAGLKKASGRYFKVVDSDDWVDAENYSRFLKVLAHLECDLIATPFTCIYQSGGQTDEKGKKIREQKKTRSVEGSKALPVGTLLDFKEHADSLHIRMHECTIRTELLKTNNIALTEHSYYVDMQYILYPVPWVESFCLLNFPVYCYRLGEEGQSVAVKSMQKNRGQHRQVLRSLVEFYRMRTEAGDAESVLAYVARGMAKMQADEVKTCLSLPIGNGAKAELMAQEAYLKSECLAAYEANEKFSIKLLRWSRYRLYRMAAILWRLVKK